MSHAEALQTLHPAAGATEAIVGFVSALRYAALDGRGATLCAAASARHHRRDDRRRGRRGRDPCRGGARRRAPGRPHSGARPRAARRPIDAAFLGGTAAHGIELDDGFRQGSVHPGLRGGAGRARARLRPAHASGAELIEAMVAGYEAETAIGRACIPTCASAASIPTAAGRRVRRGHGRRQAARAVGRSNSPTRSASPPRARPGCSPSSTAAPTSSACTPATPRARACRRRCWRSRASKGPPDVIEARDGFMQAFAYGAPTSARAGRAAAGRAVRHHRLLHQAVPVLPPHPAGGRGADRPPQRREDRDRGGEARRRSRPIASPPSMPAPAGTIMRARS